MNRADRHLQVKALKETGLTFKEIAARLNVALSTATAAYYDPTGEKDQVRRDRYKGACIECGAVTNNGGRSSGPPERCLSCHTERVRSSLELRRQHSERTKITSAVWAWTEADMLAAIRSAAVDGVVSAKSYQEAVRASGGEIPDYQSIHKRLRFSEACARAGVKLASGGWIRRDRVSEMGVVCAVQDCAAEVGRMPTYNEYDAWARRTKSPSAQTVRNRFQTWQAAVDAALLDDEQVAA